MYSENRTGARARTVPGTMGGREAVGRGTAHQGQGERLEQMARFDLAVINGTLVLPFVGTLRADVAARDGRIVQIADAIAPSDAETLIDARGKLVFPAGVDAHFHIGIYRPIAPDAESETRSALVGGVSSVVSYFRTGSHYLNRTGPYHEVFPEVLA